MWRYARGFFVCKDFRPGIEVNPVKSNCSDDWDSLKSMIFIGCYWTKSQWLRKCWVAEHFCFLSVHYHVIWLCLDCFFSSNDLLVCLDLTREFLISLISCRRAELLSILLITLMINICFCLMNFCSLHICSNLPYSVRLRCAEFNNFNVRLSHFHLNCLIAPHPSYW